MGYVGTGHCLVKTIPNGCCRCWGAESPCERGRYLVVLITVTDSVRGDPMISGRTIYYAPLDALKVSNSFPGFDCLLGIEQGVGKRLAIGATELE